MTSKSKQSQDKMDSTEAATKAAVPKQRLEPLPELGEYDGEFYMLKRIAGTDEIPLQTHVDSHEEVIRTAQNNGWIETGDVRVAEARSLGDAWDVYYAVPVRPNVLGFNDAESESGD